MHIHMCKYTEKVGNYVHDYVMTAKFHIVKGGDHARHNPQNQQGVYLRTREHIAPFKFRWREGPLPVRA